jgi:hypothetical protein
MSKWIFVFAISLLGMGEYAHHALYPFRAWTRTETSVNRPSAHSIEGRRSNTGLKSRAWKPVRSLRRQDV